MKEENPAVKPAVNADKTRAVVLEVICLAGEYPMSARYLLPGDTESAQKMVISRLKKSGIITVLGKGDEKRIRLYAKTKGHGDMAKAFEHIRDELGQDYLDHYLSISSEHRLQGDQKKCFGVCGWPRFLRFADAPESKPAHGLYPCFTRTQTMNPAWPAQAFTTAGY